MFKLAMSRERENFYLQPAANLQPDAGNPVQNLKGRRMNKFAARPGANFFKASIDRILNIL